MFPVPPEYTFAISLFAEMTDGLSCTAGQVVTEIMFSGTIGLVLGVVCDFKRAACMTITQPYFKTRQTFLQMLKKPFAKCVCSFARLRASASSLWLGHTKQGLPQTTIS